MPPGLRRCIGRRRGVTRVSVFPLFCVASIRFSPLSRHLLLVVYKLSKNNYIDSLNGAKCSRVEGRSYPPLYRAHEWAKGGWTHFRPSPFGISVGLSNRDPHKPMKGKKKNTNSHKRLSGSANAQMRGPLIEGKERIG